MPLINFKWWRWNSSQVRQGDEKAERAKWIWFWGTVSGVRRGNEQRGKQNAREVESKRANKRGERDEHRWMDKRNTTG
jgi:hypothetical protein